LGTLQFELRVVSLREFSSAEVKLIAGPLETLAQLESRLAWHILASSRLRNIPLENDFLAAQTPVNIRALESFTRGLLAATPTAQRTLWEKALEIEPTFSAAAFRLGKLQLDQENYAAAAGYLSRVRKGDWHYWQAQFLLGLAHYQNNAFLAASRAFASVVKELPLPEATNNLALAQFRAASPDAKDSMLRSLDGDDRDPHYHFNLGILLAANAEWLLAAEQFRATLARLPEDAEATKMLGRCLKPPPAVTPQMRAEWASLLRLKWELNEFAFRQLQFLLTEKLDAL
jgi:tetratricopeptide (TPR) repeat protein